VSGQINSEMHAWLVQICSGGGDYGFVGEYMN
jgi:hypothetical protein